MSPFGVLTALTISTAFIATACAQNAGPAATASDSQQIEGIAAIVNDVPVSYTDVRQRARLLLLSFGGQPTQEDIQRITGQALQQLIDEKLKLQEAQEFELEVDIQDIRGELTGMAAQMGTSLDQFYNQLLASGVNPVSLEEQTRAEIAWRRIMSGLYGSRIRISQNQIAERMAQLEASAAKTQYLMSEIFLFAPDETSKAQALQAAQSIRQQLIEGAAFSLAAQRFSSAPTAATGGDMGWISLDDVNPAALPALETLDIPGITEPVLGEDGVYIYSVRARQEPGEIKTDVTLSRVLSRSGDADALTQVSSELSGCDGLDELVNGRSDLETADLGRISLDQLGPEAVSRISAAPVGGTTEVFASGSGLAIMVVCDRLDSVGDLPSAEQVENQLFGQQLSMISDRALRDLRREATIIQRD